MYRLVFFFVTWAFPAGSLQHWGVECIEGFIIDRSARTIAIVFGLVFEFVVAPRLTQVSRVRLNCPYIKASTPTHLGSFPAASLASQSSSATD